MDQQKTAEFVDSMWDDSIIPELCDYIRVPNKSPAFDPDWAKHGYMETAVRQFADWCEKQPIEGMTVDIVRLEGRTPVLFIEVPIGRRHPVVRPLRQAAGIYRLG